MADWAWIVDVLEDGHLRRFQAARVIFGESPGAVGGGKPNACLSLLRRTRIGAAMRRPDNQREGIFRSNMNETSLSLLNRLRRSPESETWNRLVDLYAPLIRAWLRKYDVQDSDADDLGQEVLLAASKDLGKFDHKGHPGAFRGWLKAILVNRLRNFWRARDRRPQARGDSDIDERLAQLDDLCQRNEQDVEPATRSVCSSPTAGSLPNLTSPRGTWQAFYLVALKGKRADVVAKELEISVNAVFVAKSRVLKSVTTRSRRAGGFFFGFFCQELKEVFAIGSW